MTASTNGKALRVALYVRVSTGEQAKEGYSVPAQLRTTRTHAEQQGWQVVDTIVDDGLSGATLDRPGIRRIYELAEAGAIDLVLAAKRDRYFRRRLYRLQMDEDLKESGVTLVSLTDTGNRIGDGVQDDYADWEREQIAERTREGKLEKARAGNIIGANNPAFGYRYVRGLHKGKQTVVGYEVNEAEMATVRRIFSEVAGGTPIKTLTDKLDDEHVPSPKTSTIWSRPTVRAMIASDLYKPRTVNDLATLGVSEEVISNLDTDKPHGVYKYEGIPVPIPDASIPLEVVLEARRRVKGNYRPSKNAGRFWELSGGILRCSECGRAMQTHTAKGKHFYYRDQGISNAKHDFCRKRKMVRADTLEVEVWSMVRRIVDDKELLLRQTREHFEAKRAEIVRFNVPAAKVERDLCRIEKERANYQRAFAADAIDLPDLKSRMAELDAERNVLRDQLARTTRREEELGELNRAQSDLEERIRAGYDGLDEKTPEERREIYLDLNVRAEIGPDKVPHISGWFPFDHDISIYREGPEGRCLFNEERPPRHPVGEAKVGTEKSRSTGGSRAAGPGPAPGRRNPRRARAR